MPKRRGSPQPSRSPIVMFGCSFMVPKPAATPAIGKIPVVLDFPRWNGWKPNAGNCVVANRRDNGGWFWNPNGRLSYHPREKMVAPVGAAELKKRPVGRRFLPGRGKSRGLAG